MGARVVYTKHAPAESSDGLMVPTPSASGTAWTALARANAGKANLLNHTPLHAPALYCGTAYGRHRGIPLLPIYVIITTEATVQASTQEVNGRIEGMSSRVLNVSSNTIRLNIKRRKTIHVIITDEIV